MSEEEKKKAEAVLKAIEGLRKVLELAWQNPEYYRNKGMPFTKVFSDCLFVQLDLEDSSQVAVTLYFKDASVEFLK
jgi:hypothetical protein